MIYIITTILYWLITLYLFILLLLYYIDVLPYVYLYYYSYIILINYSMFIYIITSILYWLITLSFIFITYICIVRFFTAAKSTVLAFIWSLMLSNYYPLNIRFSSYELFIGYWGSSLWLIVNDNKGDINNINTIVMGIFFYIL